MFTDSKPGSPAGKTAVTPVSSRVTSQLDKISEGSESRSKSQPAARRLADLSSEKTSVTEEIDENISEISESEKSESGYLKIPKSPVQNLSLRDLKDDTASYSQDFDDAVTGTQQDKTLPLSARSVESEHSVKPVSASEHITEQYSQMYSEQFESERSESFIKPLILQKSVNDDNDLEQVSPRSQRSSYSARSGSTSGKDEADVEESESEHLEERRPQSQLGFHKEDDSIKESLPSESDISEVSRKSGSIGGLVNEKVTDIDKLLELDDEDFDDEMTPLASPRDDSPRNDMDPMSDFNIGDRVLVTGPKGHRKVGKLLFKGKVLFAPGIWAGVELFTPEGRNDGMHEGHRYFTCKAGHGVLVPGDDLMPGPVPTPRSPAQGSGGSSFTSVDESFEEQDQDNLSKLISEADKNVQMFRKETKRDVNHNDALADKITDQLLESVVRENINTMSEIAERKIPPPVAPKPNRKHELTKDDNQNLTNGVYVNGTISSSDLDSGKSSPHHEKAEKAVNILLDDALDRMITIRNKQRVKADHDLPTFDDSSISPTKELEAVLGRPDDDDDDDRLEQELDVPPRPSSPMPGSTAKNKKVGITTFHILQYFIHFVTTGKN